MRDATVDRRVLDGIVCNVYRNNPGKTAAWSLRVPRRKSPEEKGANGVTIMKDLIANLVVTLLFGVTLSSCAVAQHSAERGSPTASLVGNKVTVEPYGATFEFPLAWLSEEEKHRNPVGYRENLYISWKELDQMHVINGDNAADAQIMNAILPFELCAVHVGSKGWGNYLTNDLYARMYVLDGSVNDFEKLLETRGLQRAQAVYKTAKLKTVQNQHWRGRVMSVFKAEGHTLLFKDLSFYYQGFENKTVVFVFIHQSGWEEAMSGILNSFTWGHKERVPPAPKT